MAVHVLVCDKIEFEYFKLGENYKIDYRPGINKQELSSLISDYDAIVVRSRTIVDKEILENATRLKLIARHGTGLDNIDTEYARKKGIEVINSPEALVEAVSEHVILLMLSLSRNFFNAVSSALSGRWEKERFYGTELMGKTLGIIGFGRIGRRVSELAFSFGMKILVYDVIKLDESELSKINARLSTLDELLSNSDFVSIHVPLTEDTRNLINKERIRMMKSTSYIINTSRGQVIDEMELIKALNEGIIAGAALDVYSSEPPPQELRSARNVILTPHIAGQTKEAQQRATEIIAQKIRNYFNA